MRHVLRYSMPSTMPRSPSWHRRQLKDLITMVDAWGLQDFFLTFTVDEVTDTRWQEINVIESIATHYNAQFAWRTVLLNAWHFSTHASTCSCASICFHPTVCLAEYNTMSFVMRYRIGAPYTPTSYYGSTMMTVSELQMRLWLTSPGMRPWILETQGCEN